MSKLVHAYLSAVGGLLVVNKARLPRDEGQIAIVLNAARALRLLNRRTTTLALR